MKYARADYNRIQDPATRIPDDEPVFLLRGQDMFAANTVSHYASLIRNQRIQVECDIALKRAQVNQCNGADGLATRLELGKIVENAETLVAGLLAIEESCERHASAMRVWHKKKVPDL